MIVVVAFKDALFSFAVKLQKTPSFVLTMSKLLRPKKSSPLVVSWSKTSKLIFWPKNSSNWKICANFLKPKDEYAKKSDLNLGIVEIRTRDGWGEECERYLSAGSFLKHRWPKRGHVFGLEPKNVKNGVNLNLWRDAAIYKMDSCCKRSIYEELFLTNILICLQSPFPPTSIRETAFGYHDNCRAVLS